MKEIEDQILARKSELEDSVAPAKEKAPAAASASSGPAQNADDPDDILADIEEDFEEFTPAD